MDRLVIPLLTPAAVEVITALAQRPGLEIVGVVVDVGGDGELAGLGDAALAAGARRCHGADRRERLANGVLWPALRAGALAVPGEPVHTALSMPVVAEAVVEVCRQERATGVAVWLENRRDRQRLRALIRDLAPTLGLVSVSSASGVPTAAAPATASAARATATQNLWAKVEALGDATAEVRPAPAGARPDGASEVRIGFAHGTPVTLNGTEMGPLDLIARLATVVGGLGAGVWTVHGSASATSWRVQAPAALALAVAMDAVTSPTLDLRTAEVAATMAEAYAEVIRDGAWFSPVRAALDAFVDRVLAGVAGEVGLRVVNGRIEVQA